MDTDNLAQEREGRNRPRPLPRGRSQLPLLRRSWQCETSIRRAPLTRSSSALTPSRDSPRLHSLGPIDAKESPNDRGFPSARYFPICTRLMLGNR